MKRWKQIFEIRFSFSRNSENAARRVTSSKIASCRTPSPTFSKICFQRFIPIVLTISTSLVATSSDYWFREKRRNHAKKAVSRFPETCQTVPLDMEAVGRWPLYFLPLGPGAVGRWIRDFLRWAGESQPVGPAVGSEISAVGNQDFCRWESMFSAVGDQDFCRWESALLPLGVRISAVGAQDFKW